METSSKPRMTPAGYFGTGVAVGLLIGVFTGFLAYGVLSEDDAIHDPPRGFEPALQDLSDRPSDTHLLDAAPPSFWDDTPDDEQADEPSSAQQKGSQKTDSASGDDNDETAAPRIGGIRDIDNWPAADDDGAADDSVEESPWPNPGGGRLPKDPSIPFSPPEE